MWHNRFFIYLTVSLGLLVTGCSEVINHKGKTPFVQIGDKFLYREDIWLAMPPGLSGKDSVEFVDRYVRNWIDDMLLFIKAEGNIPDNDRIEKLIDSYRKNLITHTYLEQIVGQEVGEYISEKEIEEYYNSQSSSFLAVEPYVKGLYIKIPLNAEGMANVRNWVKGKTPEDLDRLEKYSLKNAVDYSYFYDNWKPLSEIMLKVPVKTEIDRDYINKNRNIEFKDSAFCYFLHVEEFVDKGETLPIEYASSEIKEAIINSKRVDFISRMKDDLYKNALNSNEIKYYNNSNE